MIPAASPFILEMVFLVAYLLLATQGMWNYVFGSGVLVVWKQLFVTVLIFVWLLRLGLYRSLLISSVLILSAVLCFVTVANGFGLDRAVFNIFYYIGWLPFYFFGARFSPRNNARRNVVVTSTLIIVSAIGLWLQLYTPYFDFLKDAEDAEARTTFEIDQRFAFVYSFSTGVLPVLAVFYFIAIASGASSVVRVFLLICLALAVIPTGSAAAVLMFIACLGMCFASLGTYARAISGAVLIVLSLSIAAPTTGQVGLQVDRILSNQSTESEANSGRIYLWNSAVDLILDSTASEMIFGRGIGTTNDNRFGVSYFVNSESSILQALIEGGLIGLFIRVIPFIVLVQACLRNQRKFVNVFFTFGSFLVCLIAPIFGSFGVQCGIGFVAGIASRDEA